MNRNTLQQALQESVRQIMLDSELMAAAREAWEPRELDPRELVRFRRALCTEN